MTANADCSLLQTVVERAVDQRLQAMHGQVWAHHWLLTELVRQMPRSAVLSAAQRLDQMWQESPQQKERLEGVRNEWRTYLFQLGAIVEGDTPPGLCPGQQVPERPRPAL